MKVFINKGRQKSHELQLNFLAKSGNNYLMDNHLAAFGAGAGNSIRSKITS